MKVNIVKGAARPRPPLGCPWLIDYPSEAVNSKTAK
jgi:hypothetical protein